MIHSQSTKKVLLFAPQSVATNGTATGTVSLAGWDYAEILLELGTAVASNVDATMTLTEGDSTTYATHADLTLATTAPNTSSGDLVAWQLDCRKRKKNLKITYSPNTNVARTAACIAILSRGEQAPTTAAQKGLTAVDVA